MNKLKNMRGTTLKFLAAILFILTISTVSIGNVSAADAGADDDGAEAFLAADAETDEETAGCITVSGTFEELGIADTSIVSDEGSVDVSPEFDTDSAYLTSTLQSFGVSAYSSANFYSQLSSLSGLTSAEGKLATAIYDAFVSIAESPSQTTMTVTLTSETRYTFTAASRQPTTSELSDLESYIKTATQAAVDAFFRDYPEVFWIDVNNSQWAYGYSSRYSGGQYTCMLLNLTYNITILSEYSPAASYRTKVTNAIDSFTVSGSTWYEKVKSIHDQLCQQITYSDTTYAHTIYGGLVAGKAVCEGYAKAFKAICDREGIPCVLVSGYGVNSSGTQEAHMWNYVRMDDGSWYAVDVTWDDQSSIYYDYFLCGSSSVDTHFRKKAFSETHLANGDFNMTGNASFTYPTLSETDYDVNWSTVTEEIRTPSDGREYGDVNADGSVNAEDALLVLKAYVGLEELEEDAQIAGDVTGDWELTVQDALYILKKYVGLITAFPIELAA